MPNLITTITAFGYIGIFLVVFVESGLFLFFLPGDSLLFTIGFLASQNYFSLPLLLLLCSAAAILGDSAGYFVGRNMGSKLLEREAAFWLRKEHLHKTKEFFDKHGKKTIILARFVPIVRTFAPLLAGVGEMNYQTFFLYNVTGGLLWVVGLVGGGYVLGRSIKDIDQYLLPIILAIIVLSLLPAAWEFYKGRSRK